MALVIGATTPQEWVSVPGVRPHQCEQIPRRSERRGGVTWLTREA